MTQRPAVHITDVCKSFRSRSVLKGISFQLNSGEGLCICGANAVGKTTLLKIISGLLSANSGLVQICGLDIKKQPEEIKQLIGTIFHKSMVYPQLTVIENLEFFGRLYRVENSKARIEQLLEQTGLRTYRYDIAGILSQGMMQRLAIARAILHNPAVLLADEPFAGLDAEASNLLITILRDFKSNGGIVVMTTHNVNFALQCCERAAVLDAGKLIFEKPVSEINIAKFTQDYLSYARGHN